MGTVIPQKQLMLRVIYRQNPEDKDYGSCLWACFDIDPETGMLNIQSDCGNYSYRWNDRGRDFLVLLTIINPFSVLYKLNGKPKHVSVEKTISSVREFLQDAYTDEMDESDVDVEIDNLKSRLEDYSHFNGTDLIGHILVEWADDRELDIDQAWELVHTEYSAQEERIVRIFKEHAVPAINDFLYPALKNKDAEDKDIEFSVYEKVPKLVWNKWDASEA